TLHKALSRKWREGVRQIESMSAKPQQLGPPDVGAPPSTIPMGLRVLAMALRAPFIGAVVVVTVRVSSPHSETFSSVYQTPGDMLRLTLVFAVCLWIVIHLFMLPKDAEGYRTWVYLGLVVVPLALAVAFAIWGRAPQPPCSFPGTQRAPRADAPAMTGVGPKPTRRCCALRPIRPDTSCYRRPVQARRLPLRGPRESPDRAAPGAPA